MSALILKVLLFVAYSVAIYALGYRQAKRGLAFWKPKL